MKEIDFNDFKALKDEKAIVYFGANWCRDCKFAKPILQDLAKEFKDICFYEVDVDKDENIRDLMSIRHIPTILFLHNLQEFSQRLVEPKSKDEIYKLVLNLNNA
ncbi:thioredoxin family protein [Campylobacter canadensis]|uniref:Thioredoxin family protein n=1 Tax=Campylobacter canadensis TaxID=449520 RepID=A0ABS7WTG1_9BACT|nr:thioredoxin family protein [Campylobacter canadensis]MBZ7988068.1 thioredoxin family protein [Campylobacter canadensis]MBZ7995500.1 thioredoxin family protein [Campylobacter canadensis]MBZ7997320.1 thioredoxin family protein [Campylobacter canadensis]MBZ7999033.1 thioredoxin family protein [Campylobacter canadensis]MBZ8000845.1 thioredoxin family protein [Campylobacter canadensis]